MSPGSSGSSVVQIGCHPLTAPMISIENFPQLRFELEIEPAQPDFSIEKRRAGIFSVPNSGIGSSRSLPGSLCFFLPNDRLLIGGDAAVAAASARRFTGR